MSVRLTTQIFIEKSSVIHNNFYDYSLVDYKNNSTNITIICPLHGNFTQQPNNHLNGARCKECSKITRAATNLKKYGHENIAHGTKKEKRKQTNLDRYGVEQSFQNKEIQKKRKNTLVQKYGVDNPSKYIPFQEKRKNTLVQKYGHSNPAHGVVASLLISKNNLENYGSPFWTQSHMVESLELLTEYEWMFDQYIIQGKTTTEIANNLQINCTTVNNYLRTLDIKIKQYVGFSYKCIKWLDSISIVHQVVIQHALNGGEYKIPGTRYKADGYCPETNTIYEFHGDCWHGNPLVFAPAEQCHPYSSVTAEELYQNTIERENKIKSLGYALIVIWETEFDQLFC